MKQLIRIVTWMGYTPLGTPQQLLEEGSKEYKLDDKVRLYAVRKVNYDNALNPVSTTVIPIEIPYTDLNELKKANKDAYFVNGAILDIDNKLKIYKP